MGILVGCDPEVFVKRNGVFQSAWGLIKGDKKNPLPVNKGAVQVDGMALEFNINPANSEKEFFINVNQVLLTLKGMVPDYEVVVAPVADFSIEHMKSQPEEALMLGCDPDYNGWSLEENVKPDGDRTFRTAAGHVHIGWTKDEDIKNPDHFEMCGAVARQMDYFLGLPSLIYDKDTRRREMYGNPGCFRPKPYGCEYRTLSNMWLNSEETIKWVFRAVQSGMNEFNKGNYYFVKYGDIQEIIKTSNIKEAMKIIKKAGLEVPNV